MLYSQSQFRIHPYAHISSCYEIKQLWLFGHISIYRNMTFVFPFLLCHSKRSSTAISKIFFRAQYRIHPYDRMSIYFSKPKLSIWAYFDISKYDLQKFDFLSCVFCKIRMNAIAVCLDYGLRSEVDNRFATLF